MPTGYTSALYEGTDETFEEFVMHCARAFGALVELRDSPDAPIPEEFKVSDYYYTHVKEEADKYQAVLSWTEEEARTEWKDAQKKRLAYLEEVNAKQNERRARYEARLKEVKAWDPPTKEHQGLKHFMIEQLTESIDFDCTPHAEPPFPPLQEWWDKEVERRQRSCNYSQNSLRDAEQRARARTQWVLDLRKSLGV